MKKLILPILAFLFMLPYMNGQSTVRGGYVKGFYVKKDDTTHCYIQNVGSLDGDIIYKLSDADNERKVPAKELSAFTVGTSVFEAVKYEGEDILLRVLVKGRVSLYEDTKRRYSSNDVFSKYYSGSKTGVNGTYYTINSVYFLERDDLVVKIQKRSFLEDITRVLDKNTELLKKLEKYDWKRVLEEIEAIVNNYNTWLEEQ